METVLSVENLSKHYGKINAVKDLSLKVEKGNVYGILGPNGSGKTTSLGIILGVINANKGGYSWFGNPNSKADRKRIGAILEQPLFYPYLSAEKNLQIIASIKEVNYLYIEKVLKTVELEKRKESKFRTFSYGMKQRLAIAAALLGEPEVLIFDEPTNGLDPKGIAEIRDLIIEIAGRGITIILASHLLDEVQKTCSHVAVLKEGKKLFEGKVNEVLISADTIEVAAENQEILAFAMKEFDKVIDFHPENELLIVKLQEDTSILDLNHYLIGKGITVSHLAKRKRSLESQFLELLKEAE